MVLLMPAQSGRIKEDPPREEFRDSEPLYDHHDCTASGTAPRVRCFGGFGVGGNFSWAGGIQELATQRKAGSSPTVGQEPELTDADKALWQNV